MDTVKTEVTYAIWSKINKNIVGIHVKYQIKYTIA